MTKAAERLFEHRHSVMTQAHCVIQCHFVDFLPAEQLRCGNNLPQGVKVLGRIFESYAGPEAQNNFR